MALKLGSVWMLVVLGVHMQTESAARSVGFCSTPTPLCAAPASRQCGRQTSHSFSVAPLLLCLGSSPNQDPREPSADPPAAAAAGGTAQPKFTFVGTAADLKAYMQAQQLELGEQTQEVQRTQAVSEKQSTPVAPPPAMAGDGGVSLTLVWCPPLFLFLKAE